MPRLLLALAGALVLGACAGGGSETVSVTTVETVTETSTEITTETQVVTEPVGLPPAVAETQAALLAAAESGDYEALRPFIPSEFSYTFGLPGSGGPITYWQQAEARGEESPIRILARVLALPYTLSAGRYVWPFAYDKQESDLTGYERELLGDLASSFTQSGYLGWRAGIEPDGTWRFFIAGD